MMLKLGVKIVGAVAAAAAAGMWFHASRVVVDWSDPENMPQGAIMGLQIADGPEVEPFLTAKLQGRWNSRAALAASIAAACQAFDIFLPD